MRRHVTGDVDADALAASAARRRRRRPAPRFRARSRVRARRAGRRARTSDHRPDRHVPAAAGRRARAAHRSRPRHLGLDVHRLLPVRPVLVFDQERDWRTGRATAPHAADNACAIGLDRHATAAAVAALTAPQILRDLIKIDDQAPRARRRESRRASARAIRRRSKIATSPPHCIRSFCDVRRRGTRKNHDFVDDFDRRPPCTSEGMLRFDRYLVTHSRALDLTSGNVVALERVRADACTPPQLFRSHQGRTLIDVEPAGQGRIEVWERWTPRGEPRALSEQVTIFVEAARGRAAGRAARLRSRGAAPVRSRISAPRLGARSASARMGADRGRVARCVHAPRDRANGRRGLQDRSLVVFVETPGLSGDAVLALLRLAERDARPHVLVRTLAMPSGDAPLLRHGSGSADRARRGQPLWRHARADASRPRGASGRGRRALGTAARRLDRRCQPRARAFDLADVLVAREQPFEARALVARTADAAPELDARRLEIARQLAERCHTMRGPAGGPLRNPAGREGVGHGGRLRRRVADLPGHRGRADGADARRRLSARSAASVDRGVCRPRDRWPARADARRLGNRPRRPCRAVD